MEGREDEAEGRRRGASRSVWPSPTPFAAPKRSQRQLTEVAMQRIEPQACGPVLHRLPYSRTVTPCPEPTP